MLSERYLSHLRQICSVLEEGNRGDVPLDRLQYIKLFGLIR